MNPVPTPAPGPGPAARPGEHAPINWLTTSVFTLTPLAALVLVPWYGVSQGFGGWAWASLVLFLFACGLSITVGYHRLWSHQAFQAHVAVRWVLAVFGAMALQNSILIWASQHRRHHLHVDDVDRDPYSARRGFWFSHMGWILRDYPSSRNDFSNARDLERDPVVAFQHRHYLALALGTNFGFPLALGWAVGDVWGVFLLGGLLRLVLNHHFTWFINSLAHMWGSQPYTDENTARDNPLMAFLTYGEGYHNFHHIFQNDYRNGVKWWQYDPTKWLIAALSWVGLASNLKRVPDLWIRRAQVAMQFKRTEHALAQRQARAGDEQLERARARLAEEYAAFREALDDWSRVREQWLADRRQRLLQKWEEASFRRRLGQIETALRLQQRRLRAMSRAYAAT
ncbi:MAG: fatty acid desaturase [Steroidobacteraceae bacterium]|jgi:stearoyl-CoA desaturase (delta-9 desaturase)|nr:fatty acid desaturase [Steroidobacteraceae bacterium]